MNLSLAESPPDLRRAAALWRRAAHEAERRRRAYAASIRGFKVGRYYDVPRGDHKTGKRGMFDHWRGWQKYLRLARRRYRRYARLRAKLACETASQGEKSNDPDLDST